ncbi:hypothetical protein [Microbulbifer epialgicus]|uniref:Uncharacterized protein n=1 Tax=Microbulbifer epialgicus TaxID=393907 RepID=A0ABV4NU58_9GAMM
MNRRFLTSNEKSFQAMMKNDLKFIKSKKNKDTYTLQLSLEEQAIAQVFAKSLGVNLDVYVATLMEAELLRMTNIKKRRATFEDLNEFYREVVITNQKTEKELEGLVANYQPIALSHLKNEELIKHARTRLGLRYNNYKAFKLASFDGKPSIEIIFYLDQMSSSTDYRQAWLGIKGTSLKYLSFSNIKDLCEYLQQITLCANLYDMHYMDLGPRGLRQAR